MRSKYRVNAGLLKANVSASARPLCGATAQHYPTLPSTEFSLVRVMPVQLKAVCRKISLNG